MAIRRPHEIWRDLAQIIEEAADVDDLTALLPVEQERQAPVAIAQSVGEAHAEVRLDIAQQLKLRNPELLVGTFDRPNLVYRIVPRVDALMRLGRSAEPMRPLFPCGRIPNEGAAVLRIG